MRKVILILGVLACSINSLGNGQDSVNLHLDSLIQTMKLGMDSMNISNKVQTSRIDSLTNCITRSYVQNDPFETSKFIVTLFSIIMGVIIGFCAVIMGYITWQSTRQYDESKRALNEAKNYLKTLEKQLCILTDNSKRIVMETQKYSEYFLVLFNNSLPKRMQLNQDKMKYILELASFNIEERFNAIKALGLTDDVSVIPYLEWVIFNRPDSKDEAKEAIDDINKNFDKSAQIQEKVPA